MIHLISIVITLMIIGLTGGCASISQLDRPIPIIGLRQSLDLKNQETQNLLLIAVRYNPAKKLYITTGNGGDYHSQGQYSLSNYTLEQLAKLQKNYDYEELDRWPLEALELICLVVKPKDEQHRVALLAALGKDDAIDYVEPLRSYTTLISDKAYSDTYSQLQSYINSRQLRDVHKKVTGDGVRVAIVDTGADIHHVDLAQRFSVIKNFVDNDNRQFSRDIHGTAIAGIIAANSNNNEGIVGLAPDTSLELYKACWQIEPTTSESHCSSYTLAKALAAILTSKPDVLNISLTGPFDALLARILKKMIEQGMIIVAAADESRVGFPASEKGVLSIHSMTEMQSKKLSQEVPAIAAPGVDLFSTYPENKYDFYSGSSMSTAFISGIVSLLMQSDKSLTSKQIRTILVHKSKKNVENSNVALVQGLLNYNRSD